MGRFPSWFFPVALGVAIVVSLMTAAAYFAWRYDAEEVPFSFTVSNVIGFNVDEELRFGKVPPGGVVSRSLTFFEDNERWISIISTHPWVTPMPPSLLIPGGMPVSVGVRLEVPPDAGYGNYTGKLKILSRKL